MMFENLYGKFICHENYGNNVCWRKNGLEWKTMEYLPRHLPSACRNVIHFFKKNPRAMNICVHHTAPLFSVANLKALL